MTRDLQVIDGGDVGLPDYPIDATVRLDSHGFFALQHKRWLSSRLHLRASMAVQGAAFNLICISHDQTPVGTLPCDHGDLARLLRIGDDEWSLLMRHDITPLHKWEKCMCGDEVRYMHPVVLASVDDALNRRQSNERSKQEKAIYQRRQRLREALLGLKVSKAVVDDDTLIERIDTWLEETCRGQRRLPVYERALQHAFRMGWLGGAR